MPDLTSAEAISLLFELDACPVIGVNGRTVQFLNAAARAYWPEGMRGSAIRKLLPAHIALHQANAFLGTVRLRNVPHAATVTTMPGLRLFRLEPVHADRDYPELLVPDELLSAELGLESAFFSAHAAEHEDLSVRHYAARLERTSDQLRRWVQNVSLLQALRRGEARTPDRPLDCAAMLAAILETTEPMLARRGIRLATTLPESPCRVAISPELLEALVLNLVSNAVKSCSGGGTISVSLVRGTHDVHLSVYDSGAGFAEGVLPEVFRAWREGNLPRCAKPHAGYGLPVCFAVADEVGGAIVIENNRGNGACVHVYLPLSRSTRTVLNRAESLDTHALAERCRIGLADALNEADDLR